MGRPIQKGSEDQSTVIRILDSTTFLPENAVEHDTGGIDLWYRREQEVKVSITEAALAALDTAHTDGGIELIGDGYYRLDLPNAATAIGANENSVQVGGTVTGMIVIGNEHALVDYDPYDAINMGMSALPNAAANAAGGMATSSAGGLSLDTIGSDTAAILVDTDTMEADLKTYMDAIETNLDGDIEDNDTLIDTAITDIAAVKADTAAILVDTDTMEADLTTEIDANETKIDTAIANIGTAQADITAILGDTDTMEADLVAALPDAAAINAQVLDVMNVDTFAEPAQGAPGATISIFAKINFLYKAWRNKKITDNATIELYNDAGAVVDSKIAHSDDGSDYTKGEVITGP